MSDATPPREWRFYVEDMVAFCDKALVYTQFLDRVAVRNRLIHGYLGIDDDTLWSIVSDDRVPLRAALARLLARQP